MKKSSDLLATVFITVLLLSLGILAQSKTVVADDDHQSLEFPKTCDQVPKLCLHKGSPGPECCNRQCVNLERNKFNCGKCGAKCRFDEICCGGKCVNPFRHDEHCGQCGNSCGRGDSCVYGMCAYAN
ncbi:hypothetical protein QQ045_008435 [Rhodiola kirilowii]